MFRKQVLQLVLLAYNLTDLKLGKMNGVFLLHKQDNLKFYCTSPNF